MSKVLNIIVDDELYTRLILYANTNPTKYMSRRSNNIKISTVVRDILDNKLPLLKLK